MPVVLLESTTTERRAWFANFHNPADTPSLGNNARWRAEAAGIEIAHLTALHEQDGDPVIVTGDFNERAEIFCRFTAGGIFSAAAGGSTGGSCAPPPSMQVDWIFGSTGVAFDSYAVTDTGRASDHAMVHARPRWSPSSEQAPLDVDGARYSARREGPVPAATHRRAGRPARGCRRAS